MSSARPRTAAICGLAALALAAGPVRADQASAAPASDPIVVSANRVTYYSDQAIVQARGDARVRLEDGTTIAGDAFSMDLGLRRFLVVGHVRLHTSAGDLNGAAFADYLEFRRIYFVPLDPQADRWTFLAGDFAHPKKGRVMPDDAFFLPDTSHDRPYVIAKSVVIDPTTYMRFWPARLVLLNGGLRTPPLGPYVDNYSSNYYFGVNSLAGATFDAPYDFAGGRSFLSTLHLRYDQQRGTYLSFEQHSVFDRGYAVLSLNPATRAAKQWDLLGYERTGPSSALSLQSQLFTTQRGFSTPTSSNGFWDLQFTQALPHSGLRADFTQAYDNLLGTGVTPNHPFIAGLTWSGFDEPLLGTRLVYRLVSGIARDHDVFGVSGSSSTDVWSKYLGGSLYTPVFPAPFHTGFDAAFTAQRTWLTFPNTVNSQVLQLSDSKRVNDKLYLVASYLITSARTDNPNFTIVSPNLTTGLVPPLLSPSGMPFVLQGHAAATGRTAQLTASFAPSASFQLRLTGQHNDYTPAGPSGTAAFPDQVIGDARVRISKNLFLDVQRAYNFSARGFSPQFIFQVSAQ